MVVTKGDLYLELSYEEQAIIYCFLSYYYSHNS